MTAHDLQQIADYLAALDMHLALVGGRRRRRIIAEVDDHLRQAVEEGLAAGAAIERFGPPAVVAGRTVGRHWAVRVESWRRAHAFRATAVFAGSCGVAVAFGAGPPAGVAVFALLLLARPVVDRARSARLDAGRSGPDRTPLEGAGVLAGATAGSLLAALVLPELTVTMTAVTLPGVTIVLSGGRTPWQTQLRVRRLQHPWAWGALWGALTVAGGIVASLPLGATIPAAVMLAAMHGYQTVQAAVDHVLRQRG